MAVTVISGGLKNPQIEPQEESYLQQAGRVATGAGIQGLKGLESLFSFLPETVLGVKAPHPKPSEIIKEKYGLTPEYLEPKNLPEQFIQRFSQFAPTSVALGGLPALGRTALGSGVASGLGYLGAPELLQDLAQLGTETGLGFYQGKIPTISQTKKAEDVLMRAGVKPTTMTSLGVDKINNTLRFVEEKLGTEANETLKNKIQHAIETVSSNIAKNKINPINAVDLRKSLYKLGNKLSPDEAANYIQPLTQGINDFFSVYAAENPTFYKHLNARDRLTELSHMKTYLDKFLSKANLQKIPVAGEYISDFLQIGGRELERMIRGIASNSIQRKYYFDAIKAAAQDQPYLVIKNLNSLREEEPEIKESIPSHIKILKGGLK